ncbi:DUF559 domain-containing protein [Algoriphagus aestuarii]|nr:DUF559 domain-containing protein [Algoriphagus aestuarii]
MNLLIHYHPIHSIPVLKVFDLNSGNRFIVRILDNSFFVIVENMTYSTNLFSGASAAPPQKAKELRKTLTPAERRLWEVRQNRQLDGYKFLPLPHPSPLLQEREFDPACIMVFTSKSVSEYID